MINNNSKNTSKSNKFKAFPFVSYELYRAVSLLTYLASVQYKGRVFDDSADVQGGSDLFADTQGSPAGILARSSLGPSDQHHIAESRMCLGLRLPLSPPDTTASPSRLTPSSNPQLNLDSCSSSEPGQPREDPLSCHPNSRVWGSSLLPWTLSSAQLLPVPLKLGREGQDPSYTLGPPPSAFAIEGPLTRKPPEPHHPTLRIKI